MQKKKLMTGLGALALSMTMAMGVAGPAQAAPAQVSQAQQVKAPKATAASEFTTQVTDPATNLVNTVTGTFTPTGFSNNGGTLAVEGILDYTVTNAAGAILDTVTETVTTTAALDALAAPAVGCDILNLVLGPLDLNVLGLVVQLNQVELDIIAVPGPGNLLGNLLCAVAGLLDGGNGLNGVVNILNRLLGLLG